MEISHFTVEQENLVALLENDVKISYTQMIVYDNQIVKHRLHTVLSTGSFS